MCEIKLMDESTAAKVMYDRQQFFEYRVKPNRLLARVFADPVTKQSSVDVMVARNGVKKKSFKIN